MSLEKQDRKCLECCKWSIMGASGKSSEEEAVRKPVSCGNEGLLEMGVMAILVILLQRTGLCSNPTALRRFVSSKASRLVCAYYWLWLVTFRVRWQSRAERFEEFTA
jgi:hypothetical protein